MKLKCIGGVFDGEWHNIPDGYRQHDQVRIADRPKLYDPYVAYNPFSEEATKAITVDYFIYMIDCFHFSRDNIYQFLKPEGWSNEQAVMHQFNK